MITFSYFLMTLLMFAGLFLIGLILLQRGRGGGLAGAFGGMGGQSAFGTKAGDVFTRITIGVAAAWILLCAGSVVALHNSSGGRITAGADPAAIKAKEAAEAERAKADRKGTRDPIGAGNPNGAGDPFGAGENDAEDPNLDAKPIITPPAANKTKDPADKVDPKESELEKVEADPVRAAPTDLKPDEAVPQDGEKPTDSQPETSTEDPPK